MEMGTGLHKGFHLLLVNGAVQINSRQNDSKAKQSNLSRNFSEEPGPPYSLHLHENFFH